MIDCRRRSSTDVADKRKISRRTVNQVFWQQQFQGEHERASANVITFNDSAFLFSLSPHFPCVSALPSWNPRAPSSLLSTPGDGKRNKGTTRSGRVNAGLKLSERRYLFRIIERCRNVVPYPLNNVVRAHPRIRNATRRGRMRALPILQSCRYNRGKKWNKQNIRFRNFIKPSRACANIRKYRGKVCWELL